MRLGVLFLGVLILGFNTGFSKEQTPQRPFRVDQIPNGTVNACANCHIDSRGGGARNPFGETVESFFLDATGNVVWNTELAQMDSDGDGYTNGQELGDPFGIWKPGKPAPGPSSQVSNPGDPNSTPPFNPDELSLNIHFQNMIPHIGQQLRIRIFNKQNLQEIARTTISEITDAEFDVSFLNVLAPGNSYWIDLFADFNRNGRYDSPPSDHAWRISANTVHSDTTVVFRHHTDFTDIQWPYLLTINFLDMTPHVGQVLQLRIVNSASRRETGRSTIEVPGPEFSLSVPALERGQSYQIQFYADFNGNGRYDSPPTDHAWELSLENVTDDTTLSFAHNTNFTNIDWKYAVTLNLTGMTPHLNQLFEARVVTRNGTEVDRVLLDSIGVPDFQVSLGGMELGTDYYLDFYADFNGNRRYDPPPTDHAWRIEFSAHNGDTTIDFTHNTNFTDIQYPSTAIKPLPGKSPITYQLFQNYPNPFNPSTRITFSVPVAGVIRLDIFNTAGKKVTTLVNEYLLPGTFISTWNGQDADGHPVPAGIYFYRLTGKNFSLTRKMILLK